MEHYVKINFSESFLDDLDVDVLKFWVTNLDWVFHRKHFFDDSEIYKNGKSKIHLYPVMTQKQKLQCLITVSETLNISIFTILSNFGFSFENNIRVQNFDKAISLLRSWIYELQVLSSCPIDGWTKDSIKIDYEAMEKNTFYFLREIGIDVDNN